MKKQLLFLLSIIFSINCYSQISFEKGYYVDNNNQRINCFIKNTDWRNNPTEFEYKLSEQGAVKKTTIKSVKEFGINNISKYIRSTVEIDRSSENINDLKYEKNPIFQKETLFLKVLVEGKATLYQYKEQNLIKYFYNKENSNIKQLVFKIYKVSENNIGKNNKFIQQLWIDLRCPSFKISKYENINYKKRDLIRFFTQYNKCYNNKSTNFESKTKRDFFRLAVRPRLNMSSLTIQNSDFSYRNTDYGNKVSLGLGLEAEYILPYNRNKWAIIIEPTYQRFKSEKNIPLSNGSVLTRKVNYKSIEVPVGLRHYFFLKNNAKIFINTSYVFDFSSNSSISSNGKFQDLQIKTRPNIAFGIGYKAGNRTSVELRYQTNREVLSNYFYWKSSYKTFSIIFGYTLFSKNK